MGDGKDGVVDGRKEKVKIRFFGVGIVEGLEDIIVLLICIVIWILVLDCVLEIGEVYVLEDIYLFEVVVGFREIIGFWFNFLGLRWVGELYLNILFINIYLRSVM